jgi:YidC/Oxa1 family membrane protein insertase
MERRVLLAVILSFVVLYAFQVLFVPTPPPTETAPGTDTTPAASASATPAGSSQESSAPPPQEQEPVAPAAVTGGASEREIVVETAAVEAVFSNRGGRLLHWRLKAYSGSDGQPVDLVPSVVPPDQPRPFSLAVDEESISGRLNTTLYQVSGAPTGRLEATTQPGKLAFEYRDVAGLHVVKEFEFEPDSYVVRFSATVSNAGKPLNPTVLWGPGLGDEGARTAGGSYFSGNYVQPPQAIYHRDGSVERHTASDLAEMPVHEGQFRFAGIDDHYFIAAVVAPGEARFEFHPVLVPRPDQSEERFLSQSVRLPQAPVGIRFFVGPKQLDLLRSVDAELVRAINFGMFGWLAVPLLGALKWVHFYVGNYGWSIIALTILINIAIFPLRHKSVVSMRKMQALQPHLKAIQDRYANLKTTDPARQKMNTEIMNLYREKGVNPASGCVPMLLTLPVLFAFYALLSQAIEIRGAPFGWWIRDLSQYDPYYITPVLMGITMFWQQWITPSSADPAQQRIMMIMPLMFCFMFLWAPSGLVIYWFVSNLWAIGQQYFTNWLIGAPVVQAVRPPAERRVKNVGTGRTQGAEKRP